MGISFDFFSSGYLDVSVPRVPFLADDHPLRWPGFPIRISTDQYSLAVPRGFSQLTASFVHTFVFLVSLLFQNCFLRGFFTFQFLLYTFQGSINGGDEENRTPDPLLARQVLSQLSYAPILPVVVC